MLTAPVPPTVAGRILRTTGAEQVVVHDCPACGQSHRHLAVGLRRAPCGTWYVLRLPQAA